MSSLDLFKMTVPALKAMCRERNLTGWSKLKKQDLVALLNNSGPPAVVAQLSAPILPNDPAVSSSLVSPVPDVTTPPSVAPRPSTSRPAAIPNSSQSKRPEVSSSANSNIQPPSNAIDVVSASLQTCPPPPVSQNSLPQKRSQLQEPIRPPPAKRPISRDESAHSSDLTACSVSSSLGPPSGGSAVAENRTAAATSTGHTFKKSSSNPQASTLKTSVTASPNRIETSESSNSAPRRPVAPTAVRSVTKYSAKDVQPRTVHPERRFVPLKVSSTASRTTPSHLPNASSPPGRSPIQMSVDRAVAHSADQLPSAIQHLPTHTEGSWALAASLVDLSDRERRVCCLVSKRWYCAVHLSAFYILHRDFSGRRLEMYCKNYVPDPSLVSCWSYLRQRRTEVKQTLEAYSNSFLSTFFSKLPQTTPVSPGLWCNPDHPLQVSIIHRFLISRLYLALACEAVDRWVMDTVVNAEPLPGCFEEIWRIKTLVADGTQTSFLVLFETGEVIGGSRSDSSTENPPTLPIRRDWAAFLECAARSSGALEDASSGGSNGRNTITTPLLKLPTHIFELVRWQDVEEYKAGISKAWLRRADTEELEVARRYILANVVGNSVSGRYMTPLQMAQDLEGCPPLLEHVLKEPRVNLYVDSSNYVESAHFTANGTRQPLHAALASIQTPHREVFVLRETGQEVGTEEEGVCALWRDLLGCSSKGV